MTTTTIPDDVFEICVAAYEAHINGWPWNLKSALLEYDKCVYEPLRMKIKALKAGHDSYAENNKKEISWLNNLLDDSNKEVFETRKQRDAALKRVEELEKDVDRYQRINNCGGNALHSTTLISELKAQIERATEILKVYRAAEQSGALMASMIEHDLECAREAYETNNVDGIIYWEKILSELKQ